MFSKTTFHLDDRSAPRLEIKAWGDFDIPDENSSQDLIKNSFKSGGPGGLVFVDREKRKIEIYRDALGIEAAYYSVNGNTVTVSRLPFLTTTPSLNEDFIHGVLANNFSDYTITSDRNVRIVPPGSVVRIENGREICEQWYKPDLRTYKKSLADASAELRSIISKALSEYSSRHRLGLAWGAGLDSSIIAFEAAKTNLPLKHYTFTGSLNGCEISPTILEWRAKLGSDIHFSTYEEIGAELRWTPQAEPFQFYTPNFAIMRPLMRAMKNDGVSAVLTGNGADDIFSLPKPSLKAKLLPNAMYRIGQRTTARMRKSDFVAKEIWSAQQLKKMKTMQGREPVGLNWYQKQLYNRILGGGNYQFAFRQAQDAAARSGLVHRSFFFNTKIFEFALTLPENLWTPTNLGKEIFREAYRGLLPEFFVSQRSTQDYGPMTVAMFQQQLPDMQRYIQNGTLAANHKFNFSQLLSLINSNLDSTKAFEFLKVVYCEQMMRQVRLIYEQNKKTDQNLSEAQT